MGWLPERAQFRRCLTRCDTLQINTLLREIEEFYEKLSNDARKELDKYFVFEREQNQWRGRPVQ
jgi:hypothetical protein